jgi:hypothetical protein
MILGQNFIRSSLAVLDSRNLINRKINMLESTFTFSEGEALSRLRLVKENHCNLILTFTSIRQ